MQLPGIPGGGVGGACSGLPPVNPFLANDGSGPGGSSPMNLTLGNDSNGPSATQLGGVLGQGAGNAYSPGNLTLGNDPRGSSATQVPGILGWDVGGAGGGLPPMNPYLANGGPPAMQFGGILGGAGSGLPPLDPSPYVNLAPWKSGGLGGDIFAATAPLQDTSAARLSPSALAPSAPFYDPNPPALTIDQIAMMYGMTPQDILATRDQAKDQFQMQEVAGDGATALADWLVPEYGVLSTGVAAGKRILSGKKLVTGTIDVLNNQAALTQSQREETAADWAVFRRLNDFMTQGYQTPNMPAVSRAFP